ncbi:MAG: glycosyltransferase family 2 protein, partial [Pirellula staleyi]
MVRKVNLPTISVVLPTYRRPEMLRQCLEALCKQTDMPIEIYVGRRANDAESGKVLAEYSRRSQGIVREAVVPNDANLVVSLNAALTETTGDLVALTDDDAEAPPEWLTKLRQSFCSDDIGGVGGLDIQPPNPGA